MHLPDWSWHQKATDVMAMIIAIAICDQLLSAVCTPALNVCLRNAEREKAALQCNMKEETAPASLFLSCGY